MNKAAPDTKEPGPEDPKSASAEQSRWAVLWSPQVVAALVTVLIGGIVATVVVQCSANNRHNNQLELDRIRLVSNLKLEEEKHKKDLELAERKHRQSLQLEKLRHEHQVTRDYFPEATNAKSSPLALKYIKAVSTSTTLRQWIVELELIQKTKLEEARSVVARSSVDTPEVRVARATFAAAGLPCVPSPLLSDVSKGSAHLEYKKRCDTSLVYVEYVLSVEGPTECPWRVGVSFKKDPACRHLSFPDGYEGSCLYRGEAGTVGVQVDALLDPPRVDMLLQRTDPLAPNITECRISRMLVTAKEVFVPDSEQWFMPWEQAQDPTWATKQVRSRGVHLQ